MIELDDDDGDDDDDADDGHPDQTGAPSSGGGYGRPPKDKQFQIGNPGRQPGSRNKPKTFAYELRRALEKEVNAGTDVVTARRVIATKAVRDALTGSPKTTIEFLKIMAQIEAREARNKKEKEPGLEELMKIMSD